MLFAAAMMVPAHADSEEEYHKNTIAGFIGITSADRRENGLSIGAEYERRINKIFGIGAIIGERTFGDVDTWVFALPFAFHTGPWKMYAAPGVEHDVDSNDNEPLIRLGVEYGFEISERWEIAPQVDVDFVESDAVFIFGVTFGYGF